MSRHIVSATYRGTQLRSPRAIRAALPLREGQVRCEDCQRGVRLRADGDMVGHRVNGYPCLGAGTFRYTTDEQQIAGSADHQPSPPREKATV
ncbi:hypothetical protein LG293_17255 (plasmid) [Citricoccus nitrophenolicus]